MLFHAYLIDHGEHVIADFRLEVRTADEALMRARRLAGGDTVEVWKISPAMSDWDQLLHRFERAPADPRSPRR